MSAIVPFRNQTPIRFRASRSDSSLGALVTSTVVTDAEARAAAARVASHGSPAFARAYAAARAARDKDEASAAAREALSSPPPMIGIGIAEVSAYAAEFAAGNVEIVPQIKEAMIACRRDGGTDAEIRRTGRERAKIIAIPWREAEQVTRGPCLRRQVFEAIFIKAWAAHRHGRDVDNAATKAAKDWRSRHDTAKRKRRELTASATSIADRAVRAAGQKYGPRAKKTVRELARRDAYTTARRVLKDGETTRDAYFAACRVAKGVFTS